MTDKDIVPHVQPTGFRWAGFATIRGLNVFFNRGSHTQHCSVGSLSLCELPFIGTSSADMNAVVIAVLTLQGPVLRLGCYPPHLSVVARSVVRLV